MWSNEIRTNLVNDQYFENNYKIKDNVFYLPKLNTLELTKLEDIVFFNLLH